MKTLLKHLLGILTLILLGGLPACEKPQPPLPPLFEVGARQLSLEQFEREMALAYPDISGLPAKEQFLLKKQLVHQLIDRELILGEAARLDVKISPDEMDAALSEVRGSYSQDEFNQLIRQEGKTLDSWLAALKLRLITAKVSTAILADQVQVADQEAEAYYLAHKEEYRRPLEIRARQMLFKTREDALNVLGRLDDGDDFAKLAEQYSLSPDRESGGELGYFSQGTLPREFDQVLFRLPVGQVSEPVESPYGIHLFLVERRRAAGLRPFAAVKDEITAMLVRQKEEDVFRQWLEKLRATVRVKVNWNLLDPPQTDKNL